ncbi:MAG TPA: hypothetical protein VFW98_15870, partial [Gemmatimonadaceae bacterium]|nr:hypothetical protein [Gemmatimonadaceae bacterium]
HFRIIRLPYARVLTGGSTGGWESLALQIYHPEFFGGTWSLYPDPVDLHRYQLGDVYADTNAFVVARSDWMSSEIPAERGTDGMPTFTVRQESQLEAVLGTHGRSGEQFEAWEAVYGPVGADGYPKPLWNKRTGHIDRSVANYMRDHGYDLHAYLAKHWSMVGPNLVDKIHVDVGDMDSYYLNLAVMKLQAFLDSTQHPHVPGVFHYGRPEKGHGWQHVTSGQMLREMAAAITQHAPKGADTRAWKY